MCWLRFEFKELCLHRLIFKFSLFRDNQSENFVRLDLECSQCIIPLWMSMSKVILRLFVICFLVLLCLVLFFYCSIIQCHHSFSSFHPSSPQLLPRIWGGGAKEDAFLSQCFGRDFTFYSLKQQQQWPEEQISLDFITCLVSWQTLKNKIEILFL